jgi:hypothetical protein
MRIRVRTRLDSTEMVKDKNKDKDKDNDKIKIEMIIISKKEKIFGVCSRRIKINSLHRIISTLILADSTRISNQMAAILKTMATVIDLTASKDNHLRWVEALTTTASQNIKLKAKMFIKKERKL